MPVPKAKTTALLQSLGCAARKHQKGSPACPGTLDRYFNTSAIWNTDSWDGSVEGVAYWLRKERGRNPEAQVDAPR